MSSSRSKKGKAAATAAASSSSSAKRTAKGKEKREFTYDPDAPESDVTEDEGDWEAEYEVGESRTSSSPGGSLTPRRRYQVRLLARR